MRLIRCMNGWIDEMNEKIRLTHIPVISNSIWRSFSLSPVNPLKGIFVSVPINAEHFPLSCQLNLTPPVIGNRITLSNPFPIRSNAGHFVTSVPNPTANRNTNFKGSCQIQAAFLPRPHKTTCLCVVNFLTLTPGVFEKKKHLKNFCAENFPELFFFQIWSWATERCGCFWNAWTELEEFYFRVLSPVARSQACRGLYSRREKLGD